eukprot:TRINITY_DN4708_c0_g2_i1.p1 TRINITY_DN4708_c0_g2~~TRINITY_DN4708_c0_g2_i1.p1  ORF type:complete len:359 (-),score=50.26 TRINITY_DN4708_c0_g2_i1:43-1119(-)
MQDLVVQSCPQPHSFEHATFMNKQLDTFQLSTEEKLYKIVGPPKSFVPPMLSPRTIELIRTEAEESSINRSFVLDLRENLDSRGITFKSLEILPGVEKEEVFKNGIPFGLSYNASRKHSSDIVFVRDGHPFGLAKLKKADKHEQDRIVAARGCEIITENMMVMGKPIALCIFGGLGGDFDAYLLGLKDGRLCSLMAELEGMHEQMRIFDFLAIALKFIDEYEYQLYNGDQLLKMNEKRVAFLLEHPLHPSFMHTSTKVTSGRETWWCKVWPIGYHYGNDYTFANELAGNLEAKGFHLYFNQEICAIEVRRDYLDDAEHMVSNRDFFSEVDILNQYGFQFGLAIACNRIPRDPIVLSDL